MDITKKFGRTANEFWLLAADGSSFGVPDETWLAEFRQTYATRGIEVRVYRLVEED